MYTNWPFGLPLEDVEQQSYPHTSCKTLWPLFELRKPMAPPQ
jgi:hypothetical protein